MSRYDWERGTIKLSVKEFTKFRQDLVAAYNTALAEDFDTLVNLGEKLKALGKGKRNFDFSAALSAELAKTERIGWGTAPVVKLRLIDIDDVSYRLLTKEKKVATLKKKDFTGVTVGAKHTTFPPPGSIGRDCDGSITLDPTQKTVTWSVSENNHACERAAESFFGKFFYKAMGRVEWTRDTGGVISGNDEYNRECDGPGGAANYIKHAYGPRGTAEKEAQHGFITRRLRRR